MGVDAGTPPGLWERIRSMIQTEVGKLLRSGLLRSASIGEGGLTLRGGFIRMRNRTDTANGFYFGPLNPALPDGTLQQGWIVRRDDGSTVLFLVDADVSDGQVNQALNWYDRSGNPVLADDTDSGQGLARPYVPGVLYPARYDDFTTATTAATGEWETLLEAQIPKQQPKLQVVVRATMDTSGATGEVRVLIDGTPWGSVESVGFVIGTYGFGGAQPVAGTHMQGLVVQVQGRRTAGTGGVRAAGGFLQGRQT